MYLFLLVYHVTKIQFTRRYLLFNGFLCPKPMSSSTPSQGSTTLDNDPENEAEYITKMMLLLYALINKITEILNGPIFIAM